MDNPNDNDGPIEQFLSPGIPEDRTELRRLLLTRTLKTLRRRRRGKQLGYLAALVGCYLAGLGTMRLANARNDDGVARNDAPLAVRSDAPPDAKAPTHVLLPIDQDPDVPASLLERVAALNKDNQVALYRRAGDRYLEENGDVQAALRCYGRALDRAKAEELAISEDDNWLLMELKKARLEGKNHAQTGT